MTLPGRPASDDRGSTLLVAMLVMGVAVALTLLVVGVAVGSSRSTGTDRQRLVAVNAAEAGVDAAYVTIQSSGVLLPCSWPLYGTQDLATAPDRTTGRATIVYTGASGATGCPLAAGDAPVKAVITGTGTAGSATPRSRRMEALVNLAPVVGDGLDKAMFGDRGVAVQQSGTVTAPPGEKSDIYTNGDFACANSTRFAGSVIAPTGRITMTGTCGATGDVWALGAVVLEGNKTIGGRVLSATAGITAAGNTTVNGTLMAKLAITWPGCAQPAKCLADQSAVPAPPVSPFPELRGDLAAIAKWTAAGYTQVALTGPCNAAHLGDDLADRLRTLTTKTLFTTDCHVELRGTRSTPVRADAAVLARGGVSTSNQVDLVSPNGPHTVHFIQPFDAVPSRPCTRYPSSSPVMGPSQSFTASADLTLLWYSPCDIAYGNQGTAYGQVISGSSLIVNNNFSLGYRRPFLPDGAVGNATTTTTSYSLDVVYKRETD